MKAYHVGIDYHKRYSTVCVLDDAGNVVVEGTVMPNTREKFAAFFQALGDEVKMRVVYECGLNWGYLFDLLEELPQVGEILLANAAQTKIIGQAQIKTDKIDARKLAWLLRANLIPTVNIPSRTIRARREVVRQRMFWVATRTRLRNRIHRILERRQRELAMPQVSDLFGKKGLEALRKAKLPEPDATLLRQDLELLEKLGELIRQNEAWTKTEMAEERDLQILLSLPGFGAVLASLLVLEIAGIERFPDPDRLCAYSGLVPSTHSSGGKTWQGRMLAGCNKWLKWAFIEAAWVAVGHDPYCGQLYREHRARGKKANTAITIVARRLCRIAWRLLKDQREYADFPPTSSSGRPRLGLTKSPALA